MTSSRSCELARHRPSIVPTATSLRAAGGPTGGFLVCRARKGLACFSLSGAAGLVPGVVEWQEKPPFFLELGCCPTMLLDLAHAATRQQSKPGPRESSRAYAGLVLGFLGCGEGNSARESELRNKHTKNAKRGTRRSSLACWGQPEHRQHLRPTCLHVLK